MLYYSLRLEIGLTSLEIQIQFCHLRYWLKLIFANLLVALTLQDNFSPSWLVEIKSDLRLCGFPHNIWSQLVIRNKRVILLKYLYEYTIGIKRIILNLNLSMPESSFAVVKYLVDILATQKRHFILPRFSILHSPFLKRRFC